MERRDGTLAADVVVLPWPHSFREERLIAAPPREAWRKEEVLARIPPCRLAVHGDGVSGEELSMAGAVLSPGSDELFLRRNAQLTAEGAVCRAMQQMERALLGSTCLITGYGRIGQELAVRLTAMGAFVIVCARSETQMRAAHAAGAHPVPLAQAVTAAAQADLILNTVPAPVLGEDALSAIRPQTPLLELASAPYGLNLEAAKRLGVQVSVEGGVPGRYAPLEAGAAIFEAALRALSGSGEGKADG